MARRAGKGAGDREDVADAGAERRRRGVAIVFPAHPAYDLLA